MHIMKKQLYYLGIVIFLISFLGTLEAQTILRGQVTDDADGEALVGVQVFADGTPAFTETDERGNYELQIPYKKDQVYQLVRFQYLGYAEYSDFYRVTPDGKLFESEEDIKLTS